MENDENEIKICEEPKISGLLILPLIGLFISPVYTIYFVIKDILPVFEPNIWNRLTSVDSELYNIFWTPTIYFELVGNLLIATFTILIIVKYLKKRKNTPRFMIILYTANFLFILFDYIICNFLLELEQVNLNMDIIRSLLICFIWIPYFILSKKVKSTFIK
ncbi:MAG: DUF2569 domain-containing protein [Deltaproteobacteria bacterium]|nr:DUF2569 domain-containing protein [Deltaproteobacteria bacterium]